MINLGTEILVRSPKPRVIIEKPSAKGMLSQMFLVLVLHLLIVTLLVIAISYFIFKIFS